MYSALKWQKLENTNGASRTDPKWGWDVTSKFTGFSWLPMKKYVSAQKKDWS